VVVQATDLRLPDNTPTHQALMSPRNPITHLRNRWQRWWQSRAQASDTHMLKQRNVYIVPTGAGWMMALTVAVLLLASINFQLNLGYLLTFLIAGAALASMHAGHANLRDLQLQLMPVQAVFEGEPLQLQVACQNPGPRARWALGAKSMPPQRSRLVRGKASAPQPSPIDWAWYDVAAQTTTQWVLAVHPMRRGHHLLPLLTLETRYPLGLFRVWTWWRPAARVWVYPRPEIAPPPWPQQTGHGEGGQPQTQAASNEFEGVRPYRAGDPARSVVWKKAAKRMALAQPGTFDAHLISRDRAAMPSYHHWLDLADTHCTAHELALSRLCAWLLKAHEEGLTVGLRLPTRTLEPATGARHLHDCLRALAAC
jgi:uncharacterized protein (DUF58 family)